MGAEGARAASGAGWQRHAAYLGRHGSPNAPPAARPLEEAEAGRSGRYVPRRMAATQTQASRNGLYRVLDPAFGALGSKDTGLPDLRGPPSSRRQQCHFTVELLARLRGAGAAWHPLEIKLQQATTRFAAPGARRPTCGTQQSLPQPLALLITVINDPLARSAQPNRPRSSRRRVPPARPAHRHCRPRVERPLPR